jgi:hypothetical protein
VQHVGLLQNIINNQRANVGRRDRRMGLQNMELIVSFVQEHQYLVKGVGLYFAAAFAAFVLYAVNRLQRRQPFSLFQVLNFDVVSTGASGHMILLDMFISSMIGAGVVSLLSSPSTAPDALTVGLGWTGLVSLHTTELEN